MSQVLFDLVGMLWLYSVLAMLPLPWLIARATTALVASGAVTTPERRRFVVGVAVVVCLLIGVQLGFALATHNRNPLCEGPDSAATVVNVVMTALLLVGIAWLWLGDGAAFLARFLPLFFSSRKTYTARQVWWVVGAFVLLLLIPFPSKWQRSIQTTLCTEQQHRTPDPTKQLQWWLWQHRREA